MRRLSPSEVNLVNSDLIPFDEFFKINGLDSELFWKKYSNTKIMAENKETLKGANGTHNIVDGQNCVTLLENIMSNESLRSHTLYHELGHVLLGLQASNNSVSDSVITSIAVTQNANRDELKDEVGVYLDGVTLLEEYLVEKFAIMMTTKAKGMLEPQRVEARNPQISGNYTAYTTFRDSNYWIFEEICDNLVGKAYGNTQEAISQGLQEKYFTGLFEKYDNVELMKILGNLGHIKRAIYSHAQHGEQYNYSPEQVHKILDDTNTMVEQIVPIRNRENVTITPTDISHASQSAIRNNPGEVSEGVRRSGGFLSRLTNKNKER